MKRSLIITILFLVNGHGVYAMHHAKRDELGDLEAGYGRGVQRSHSIFSASRLAALAIRPTPPGHAVCVRSSKDVSNVQSKVKLASSVARVREQRAGSLFARGGAEVPHRVRDSEVDIESQDPIERGSKLERCKAKFTTWWAGLSQAQKDTAIVGGLTLLTAGTTLGCYYLGVPVVVAKAVCYIAGEAAADTLQRLKYYKKFLIGLPPVIIEGILHTLGYLPDGTILDETGITLLSVYMFWVHGGFSDYETAIGLPGDAGQALTELPKEVLAAIGSEVV